MDKERIPEIDEILSKLKVDKDSILEINEIFSKLAEDTLRSMTGALDQCMQVLKKAVEEFETDTSDKEE